MCKEYENQEDVDCNKCQENNNMPYDYCCRNECGEHEFCRGCKSK